MKLFAASLLIIIISSCSGIRVVNRVQNQDYESMLSQSFRKRILRARKLEKQKKYSKAYDLIKGAPFQGLSLEEKAYQANALGVIAYKKKNWRLAQKNFSNALTFIEIDHPFRSHVQINQGNTLYKQSKYTEAKSSIDNVRTRDLSENEFNQYSLLWYLLAKKEGSSQEQLESLVSLLRNEKNFETMENNKYFLELMDIYESFPKEKRREFLEENKGRKYKSISYLAYKEAVKDLQFTDYEKVKQSAKWLKDGFGDDEEVVLKAASLLESVGKPLIGEKLNIGIFLPFSGRKRKFSRRVMQAIDFATRLYFGEVDVQFHIRDSDSELSPQFDDLLSNHQVYFVIGGLFPKEGVKEYYEAKKRGLVYVSLSPLDLAKEEKNNFLVEVPGSIESQVASFLSENHLSKIGKRGVVLCPDTERGKLYLKEMWSQGEMANIDFRDLQLFPANISDFREVIKSVLGLKHPQMRPEELELWEKIYELKNVTSVRRIQTLPPVVDFDWVFMPVHPKTFVQLTPVFKYYDATEIIFVGGPSWQSRSVVKNSHDDNYQLMFVGNSRTAFEKESRLSSQYKRLMGSIPKAVENNIIEAMTLIKNMVVLPSGKLRTDFFKVFGSIKSLRSQRLKWNLNDGVWTKAMNLNTIKDGEIAAYLQ